MVVYLLQIAIPRAWHSSALGVEKGKVLSSLPGSCFAGGAFTYKHLNWIHFTGDVPVYEYVIFTTLELKEIMSCCVTGKPPCKLLVSSAIAVLFLSNISI